MSVKTKPRVRVPLEPHGAEREELRKHDPPAAAWLDYVDLSDPDFPATEDQEACFHRGWFAGRADADQGAKDLVAMCKRFYDAEREWTASLAAFKSLFPEETT